MREILFRGKRVKPVALVSQWILGNHVFKADDSLPGLGKHFIVVHDGFGLSQWVEVDPDTIGQFTGLTDKNGKKIFEGDIVQFSLITGRSLVPQGLRQVTFSAGSFMIEDPYSGDDETISRIAASVELEVVGNIYDNPDMIADYVQSVRQELMEDE